MYLEARSAFPLPPTNFLLYHFYNPTMNAKTTQCLNVSLRDIPNIEEPNLTKTHHEILAYLKKQKTPRLAKTISNQLGISYNSTRARLHELSKASLVYQPMKGLKIHDLDESGMIHVFPKIKKCGYMIRQ